MAGDQDIERAREAVRQLCDLAVSLQAERDQLRELVPTPLNTWGARGYEIDYCQEGPGATPRWCLGLNGVGHVPIAWFYRKADALRCVEAEARAQEAEAQLLSAREALEPFAKIADHYDRKSRRSNDGGQTWELCPDDEFVSGVRLGWCRRASTACPDHKGDKQ